MAAKKGTRCPYCDLPKGWHSDDCPRALDIYYEVAGVKVCARCGLIYPLHETLCKHYDGTNGYVRKETDT
jgi:hypothetical protein